MIFDEKGAMFDLAKEAKHAMEPVKTALGGGWGHRKLRDGKVAWKIAIPYQTRYTVSATGSFLRR